jgi:hypothetical protein
VPGAAAAGAGAGGGGAAAAEEAAAAAAALFGGPVEKPDCLSVEGMPRGVLAELDTPNEAPGGGSSGSAGAGGKASGGGAGGEEEKKPWQKRDAAVAAVTAAMERAAGLGGVKVRVLAVPLVGSSWSGRCGRWGARGLGLLDVGQGSDASLVGNFNSSPGVVLSLQQPI